MRRGPWRTAVMLPVLGSAVFEPDLTLSQLPKWLRHWELKLFRLRALELLLKKADG